MEPTDEMSRIILAGMKPPKFAGNPSDEERVHILNKPISRLEYTQAIAPFTNAVQQHEGLLSFILERGFKVVTDPTGLRAVIDQEELREWAAQRNLLPFQPEKEPPPS